MLGNLLECFERSPPSAILRSALEDDRQDRSMSFDDFGGLLPTISDEVQRAGDPFRMAVKAAVDLDNTPTMQKAFGRSEIGSAQPLSRGLCCTAAIGCNDSTSGLLRYQLPRCGRRDTFGGDLSRWLT